MLDKLKKFLRYYKPHWKIFALDMATAVLISFMTVLIPYIIKQILDVYLKQHDMRMIIIALALILGLAIALAAANYINIRWGHTLGVRMEADMRSELFRHLQKLSFSYFDRTKTGHIISRISNDLTQIAEVAHHAPEDLLISGCTIIGAFTIMFNFNPKMAMITLIPLPFILVWGMIFQKKMREGFRTVRKKVADINSRVENSIQGIREVKSYTNEKQEIEKFYEVNTAFQRARENIFTTLAGFHSGMMFLIQCYSLLIIGAGAILMYYGQATMTDIVTFFLYNRFITHPIFKLVGFTEQFQQGGAAFDRFIEIIEVEPEIKDCDNPICPDEMKGNIEFRNVSFRYNSVDEGEIVLDDVSFQITAGQTIALVGESGAGKSTIAALLPRFYEPESGEILIDGNNIMQLKQEFLRANIGLVQQNVFLFDATIRENIVFGRPDATEDDLIDAAKRANIYDFIMEQADGFDTLVGEHGVMLSGGQKQRVSIARVFLKNPPILIFDEATSSLDNESEKLIQQSMEDLCKNRTTLVIAHRLTTVRNADYTYVIRRGKIVESGTHNDLIAADGYYCKLHKMHDLP